MKTGLKSAKKPIGDVPFNITELPSAQTLNAMAAAIKELQEKMGELVDPASTGAGSLDVDTTELALVGRIKMDGTTGKFQIKKIALKKVNNKIKIANVEGDDDDDYADQHDVTECDGNGTADGGTY